MGLERSSSRSTFLEDAANWLLPVDGCWEHVEAHVAGLLAARRGDLLDEVDCFALGGRRDLEIGHRIGFGLRRGRRLRARGSGHGRHDRPGVISIAEPIFIAILPTDAPSRDMPAP